MNAATNAHRISEGSITLPNDSILWRDDTASRQNQNPGPASIREAISIYKPAILWCMAIQMIVIMEGYDTTLIGNFVAFPSFQRKFGDFVGVSETVPSGYQLSPAWMAGISQSAGVGLFIGALLNGYLVTKYGSRKVLICGLGLAGALQSICFFAPTKAVLVVGQVLNGLPWGVFVTGAPAYSSEVLPKQLRTYITSCTNTCFVLGQLVSASLLKSFSTRQDPWGYRTPFALQWIWPIILIPVIYYARESPWYLARMNRLEDAENSIQRLHGKTTDYIDNKAILAGIICTDKLERDLSVGITYWDCFKQFELRRTEIACICSAGQVLAGMCFAYNNSFFFAAIGLGTSTTFSLSLGGTAMALAATTISWTCLMPHFGRRTIYVIGMGVMSGLLLLVGILNKWTHHRGVAMTQAVLTLVWTFVFQLSVGPLSWALPAEVGSTRLRQKTICLARNAFLVTIITSGILNQYMLNTNKGLGGWDLRGNAAFFWGGTATLTTIWAYFRLPETWDKSYYELDIFFAKSVPAKDFMTTRVEVLDRSDHVTTV